MYCICLVPFSMMMKCFQVALAAMSNGLSMSQYVMLQSQDLQLWMLYLLLVSATIEMIITHFVSMKEK